MTKEISKLDLEYFNKFKEGYFPYSQEDEDKIIKKIINVISDFRSPKICEMGSGSGQFSILLDKQLANNKPDLYGVDIANEILKYYPYNKINASAFNVPVKNNFFDLVCYPASLHHLTPIEKSLKEMDRIIKANGIFYCLEPNLFHPHRFLFMRFQKLYHLLKKIDDVPINPKKLRDYLLENNYDIITFYYLNINFKNPGILQKIQNLISKSILSKLLPSFFLPWFILIAKKQ